MIFSWWYALSTLWLVYPHIKTCYILNLNQKIILNRLPFLLKHVMKGFPEYFSFIFCFKFILANFSMIAWYLKNQPELIFSFLHFKLIFSIPWPPGSTSYWHIALKMMYNWPILPWQYFWMCSFCTLYLIPSNFYIDVNLNYSKKLNYSIYLRNFLFLHLTLWYYFVVTTWFELYDGKALFLVLLCPSFWSLAHEAL